MTLQNNHPYPKEVYNVTRQAISDQCFNSNVRIQESTAFDFLLVTQTKLSFSSNTLAFSS
eukprot:845914-Rhodomonas_salina.1